MCLRRCLVNSTCVPTFAFPGWSSEIYLLIRSSCWLSKTTLHPLMMQAESIKDICINNHVSHIQVWIWEYTRHLCVSCKLISVFILQIADMSIFSKARGIWNHPAGNFISWLLSCFRAYSSSSDGSKGVWDIGIGCYRIEAIPKCEILNMQEAICILCNDQHKYHGPRSQ